MADTECGGRTLGVCGGVVTGAARGAKGDANEAARSDIAGEAVRAWGGTPGVGRRAGSGDDGTSGGCGREVAIAGGAAPLLLVGVNEGSGEKLGGDCCCCGGCSSVGGGGSGGGGGGEVVAGGE